MMQWQKEGNREGGHKKGFERGVGGGGGGGGSMRLKQRQQGIAGILLGPLNMGTSM